MRRNVEVALREVIIIRAGTIGCQRLHTPRWRPADGGLNVEAHTSATDQIELEQWDNPPPG